MKKKKRKTFVCKSLLNDTEDFDQTHRFMITNITFSLFTSKPCKSLAGYSRIRN